MLKNNLDEPTKWYEVDPDTGCWNWTGNLGWNGYGELSVNTKHTRAHRWFYEKAKGPIPKGLCLDHLCRNRRCVNPEHLEPVTQRENVLRGNGHAAKNAKKTPCPKSHEYTPENTRVDNFGKRSCRECARIRAKQKYATIKSGTGGES